jgi:uroporphyrinogen-III synthase
LGPACDSKHRQYINLDTRFRWAEQSAAGKLDNKPGARSFGYNGGAMGDEQRNGLAGLRVLCLESRRAQEMAKLIANYGGEPIVAPSMQEVTLKDNPEALAFARRLSEGAFDMVIFLTGVGTRALVRLVEAQGKDFAGGRQQFAEALRRVTTVARGPKPAAALAEMGIPATIAVPEPNTWRELLATLDARADSFPLKGKRVAVQEYGAANPELLAGLSERGASVTRVPVYEWALPGDTGPLRDSVQAIVNGGIDVALFTTSVQVQHLLRIAEEAQLEERLRSAFGRIVVGSIGPMTSEALRQNGLPVDFEPEHPKMGFLVAEGAQRARGLLEEKRRRG